jgi:hypothetical protein
MCRERNRIHENDRAAIVEGQNRIIAAIGVCVSSGQLHDGILGLDREGHGRKNGSLRNAHMAAVDHHWHSCDSLPALIRGS